MHFTCSASAGQQLMRIVVVLVVGTKLNYLRRLWCFSAVDVLLLLLVFCCCWAIEILALPLKI